MPDLYSTLFRTVSYYPLTLITRVSPIEYSIAKRSILCQSSHKLKIHWKIFTRPSESQLRSFSPGQLKNFLKEEACRLWKIDCESSLKGEWSKTLFSTMDLTSPLPSPDFYLTQGLSGHGCFGSYLAKFKRRESDRCPCCNVLET